MAKKRNKLLIVDGYNVLRSGSRYLHMRNREDFTYEKFNMVREALISDVAAYAGSEYKAIIVFDAADNPESAGKTQTIGGVKSCFRHMALRQIRSSKNFPMMPASVVSR